ncbi:MAG: amino acid ABC transporter ATP-binding protein [Acutalibacteraceae bacterium]|nr:amino acid ABC transporter ATP-binding protein [Acutalibacteraceae bacterium]
MALLEINHLQKSFGSLNVLKDINLQVEEGQVIAVIGPSGSGKSTMLRCATTLEQADAGDIYYDGEPLIHMVNGEAVRADKQQLKKIRSFFGLVFQDYNLFPHFTVMRNITEAPVHVAGVSKEKAEERALQLLATMGLSGKENYYPSQLSGGQQQRVAIARALAMDPKILFFDEPTSALDPELTQEVLKVIRGLAEQHMTMVIVTHEMSFARDVADEIIFMDGGVIVEQGPAKQLIEDPQTERLQSFLHRML